MQQSQNSQSQPGSGFSPTAGTAPGPEYLHSQGANGSVRKSCGLFQRAYVQWLLSYRLYSRFLGCDTSKDQNRAPRCNTMQAHGGHTKILLRAGKLLFVKTRHGQRILALTQGLFQKPMLRNLCIYIYARPPPQDPP